MRFKLWWMIPTTGACVATVSTETHMLLLEYTSEAGSAARTEPDSLYALMLPVLDGVFRATR